MSVPVSSGAAVISPSITRSARKLPGEREGKEKYGVGCTFLNSKRKRKKKSVKFIQK